MELREVVGQFQTKGEMVSCEPYGHGHINDTYLVVTTGTKGPVRYILQRMNTAIFTDPVRLMENIVGVTRYLTEKIKARGGDPDRETLQVIPTVADQSFYTDVKNNAYRMFLFIEDAGSYDTVKSAEDFYESAVAFGNFQALLADYPAATLHETIPDFHNTRKRYENFEAAVAADVNDRCRLVAPEIAFIRARRSETDRLLKLQAAGELPLRVTHNDTKLNNIMIDNQTHKGICVIDLDTVMPGLSLYDFGDAIRFGANTAAEDETDLSLVTLDLELYSRYVAGYMTGCQGRLTANEVRELPWGAKLMTLECGMRFLTDYLEGDHYFKIHREHHNLDRTRTQLALVADMERKWTRMEEVVNAYRQAH